MAAVLLLLLMGGGRGNPVPGWSTVSVTAPGTTVAVTSVTTEATVS